MRTTFSPVRDSWQPPIELQRSTPREVQLTATGKAAVIATFLLTAAAIFGSVLLGGRAVEDRRRWEAWNADAAPTSAVVAGLRKRGSGESTRYYVDYTYRVGDQVYAASSTVRSHAWKSLRQGQTFDVRYRKSAPATSWLPGKEPEGVPWFAAPLLGISLLIPVPVMAYFLRKQRRLLEEGRAAKGTVTSSKRMSHERGSYFRVAYEFETIAGGRRSGNYTVNRQAPQPGESLVVIYHPEEERWSAKYPLSMVRVRD